MLDRYKEKRDFARTPEPRGGDGSGWGSLRFVVQKHAARRLHYDVRLEIGGTLKSWPVPKGPSFDPNEKRLAVMVEDHPLDYLTFEAVIAPGNYGAGQMIVWDTGVYSPDEDGVLSFGDRETSDRRMQEGLAAGKLSFTLRGRKLRGSWTLVKTTRGEREWLLIKHKDAHARTGPDVLDDGASVLSKLTIDDLKAGRLPDPTPLDRRLARRGTEARFPASVKPMLAKLTDRPFDGDGWLFEPKMDGFRLLAFVEMGSVRLRSRNGNDMTALYPEVAEELRAQPHESFVLDGEVVVLDEAGLPSFGLMQRRMGGSKVEGAPGAAGVLMYYPFDLLYLDGYNVRRAPLSERKDLLARMLDPGDVVRPIEYALNGGEAFYAAATRLGLEGVVAKRVDSVYEPGRRGTAWLKIKATQSQEMVVGGYSAGAGARASTFGSLLVGYYDDDTLRFAARVGTGFDQATLDDLYERMQPLRVEESPFAPDPELGVAGDVWLRPELVARVKFAEWGAGEHLRAPVFLGLEPDRDPRSVVRERPAVPPPVSLSTSERTPPSPPRRPGIAEDAADAVAQLAGKAGRDGSMLLDAGGHTISVTNLDKALWPETPERAAITKRDMLTYYARIAPAILPHLRDRPLTLTRYPNGVDAPSFYQKNWSYEPPRIRGDGEAVLVAQRGRRRVRYGEQPGHAAVAGAARRHRDAPLALPPRHRPRRHGTGDDVHRLEGEHRGQHPQLPRLPRLRLRPLHLFRRGRGGRRARAQPPRFRQGRGDRAGAEGHPRRALTVVVPEDIGEDGAPRLRPRAPRAPLSCHPQGHGAHRALPDGAAPARRNDGVGREQARGEDLPRPQPERARQEHGVGLLAAAVAGRAGVYAAALGRARRRLPRRLHHRRCARAGGAPRRPVGGHPRRQARPPSAGGGGVERCM